MLGSADLKLGMLAQVEFRNNIQCVPPGYTSFFVGMKGKNSLYICMYET